MAILIAEFCQNHKGGRGLLKEMIVAAKESGATYAKIQTIFSEDLTKRERFEEGKIAPDGSVLAIKRPYQPEFDRLHAMDLTMDDYAWFVEECNRVGIKPLTTVFTRGRIKDMASLGWKDVKVASYDCASIPLIQELKQHFSHLFISTGATHEWEIERTAMELQDHSFSFLHCVTIYPTPLSDLHLHRMHWLQTFTPSVGFSDHTLVSRDGVKASMAALALGAEVIERHFTILPSDQTKDGPVSINPSQLKELADFSLLPICERYNKIKQLIPDFSSVLGQEHRQLTATELLNRDYYRGRFATKTDDNLLQNWDKNE